MHHRACLGVAVAVAGILSACKSERSPDSSDAADAGKTSPAAISVTAKDFSFDAPEQVPAGATTFRLANHGKELHQAQLIKLEDGKTVADLTEALKQPGPPPSWIKWMGGPNGIAPGQEANATAVLEPGQYAYLCLIPSPGDGKPHSAKGMIRPFTVTEAPSSSSTDLPQPDITIKLKDYDFESSQPLTAGKHTILVENAGPQPHEVVILKMAPGKKVEDFAHWAETGLKGPPPAQPLGGVVVLEKGGRGTFDVELTAGDYGLICFVPDAKDGKMHLMHGMMKTVTVS